MCNFQDSTYHRIAIKCQTFRCSLFVFVPPRENITKLVNINQRAATAGEETIWLEMSRVRCSEPGRGLVGTQGRDLTLWS